MRPDKFSLAKAWINDERSTPEEARATWNAMDQEFNENRKIFLASAESDALKDAINKKFGPGTIKYGSEIPQPPARPDVIEIDAINAFMKRNPAAEGGQMVKPSVDGSRPGYAGNIKKQKVGKYTIERKGPAGLLQPRDMDAEPLTPYEKIKLKKKFPNIKFNFKEYPNFGIGSYDKKLKRKVNTKEYDAVRRFIFRGFVDTTKFKVLPVSVQNEIKGQFPEVKNWDFKKYAYGVSPGRIGEKERRLKGLPPNDNRALVRKIARFVDEPEEFRYKFRVGNADGFMLYSMDRAFLQGNENYKPIKQGGKVIGFIDYTKDGGGKKYYYNGYIVNNKLKPGEKIIKDHPDFKKVKKFHEVALRSKLSLDDTSNVFKQMFPKGFDTSKIKFNDLVQFVSNKASKRNIYNAIVKHHTTGVGTNPTKDLQILTSVFNKQADDIGALIKKGDFSRVQELKDKGIRIVVDGKAYGAPKETAETGYQRILSNVIEDVKTYESKDFNKFKTYLKAIGCPNAKAGGGRIEFSEGADCFDKGQKLINNGMKGASQASMRNAAKFLNSAYRFGRNVTKFGIIPEAVFVTGETLLRSLGDQTLEEGLKSSIGFYTDWTGLTDLKSDARISQNMRNMGVDATMNIERLVDFNNATEKVNKLKKAKEFDLSVNDESLTGLTDQEVAANADKNIKAAQINLDNKFLKESEKLYFSQQQDEAADIAGTKSPFQKAYAAAKNKTENLRSDGSIINLNDLSGMQSDMFMIDPMSAKAKKDSVKNLPPRSPLTGSKGETAFLNLSQLPMGPRMGSEIDVLAKAMNENFKLQGSDQRTDAAYLKAMQDYKNNYKNMTMEEMLAIGIPREAIYGFNQPEVIKEKPVYDFSEGGITGLRSKYEYKK